MKNILGTANESTLRKEHLCLPSGTLLSQFGFKYSRVALQLGLAHHCKRDGTKDQEHGLTARKYHCHNTQGRCADPGSVLLIILITLEIPP
jgi:hypothetical protein